MAKAAYTVLKALRKNAKSPKNWKVLMQAHQAQLQPEMAQSRVKAINSDLVTIVLGGRLPVSSRKFLDERIDKEIPLWLKLPRLPLLSFTTIPHTCEYVFNGDGFVLLRIQAQKLKWVGGRRRKLRKPRRKKKSK